MEELNVEFSVDDMIDVVSNVTSPFVVISELIKNGVDANATSIKVSLDTSIGTISIKDNGDGFTLNEISKITKIAQSNKKKEDYFYNEKGDTLLGSKGLAIYSVFSLGEKLEIFTSSHEGTFHFVWENGTAPLYEKITDDSSNRGTKVVISDIEVDDMILLSSNKELSKFKHISMNNFVNDMDLANIIIEKDGQDFDVSVDNITSFESDFDIIISFNYDSNDNLLTYSYHSDDDRIDSQEIIFDLNNTESMDSILTEKYQIKPIKIKFDDYLTGGLVHLNGINIPSFEGKWYSKTGRKTIKLNKFESGIKVYVNKFSLYDYLNRNNDWLQLTNITQTKKTNDFKQHNVYGYVSFDNFDDHSEGMKISNERGGFIENKYYHKFIDVLYTHILYPTISLNLAVKNNSFIGQPQENNDSTTGEDEVITGEDEVITGEDEVITGEDEVISGEDEVISGEDEVITGEDEVITGEDEVITGEDEVITGEDEVITGEDEVITGEDEVITGEDEANTETDSEENLIGQRLLKVNDIEINHGDSLYLEDSDIIEPKLFNNITIFCGNLKVGTDQIVSTDNPPGIYSIDYNKKGADKETLNLRINARRIVNERKENVFFRESSHFYGDIDLSNMSELANQIYDLDYSKKYLLFSISFRAILEDIVKDYIGNREDLNLTGKFKENFETMIKDLQKVTEINKNDALSAEKIAIHKRFKGRDALKNFLSSMLIKFNISSYDQLLHSMTHNPAKIDKDLALEISNDIILPLYVLINCLREDSIV